MKKTMIIAALAAVGLSASASAFTFEKSKLTLGVMPVYSMPQGNRGDVLDNSLGLNISGEYVVQDNIKLKSQLVVLGTKGDVFGGRVVCVYDG